MIHPQIKKQRLESAMTPALALVLSLAAMLAAAEPPAAPPLPPPPPAAECAVKLAVMAPCLPGAANTAATPPSDACCEVFRSASLGGESSCLCQLAKNPHILGLSLSRVAFTFHSCGGAASAAAASVNHTCKVHEILPNPVHDAPKPHIMPPPPTVIPSGATCRDMHVLVVSAAVLLLLR